MTNPEKKYIRGRTESGQLLNFGKHTGSQFQLTGCLQKNSKKASTQIFITIHKIKEL